MVNNQSKNLVINNTVNRKVKVLFLTSGHSPYSVRLFDKELHSLKKIFSDLTILAPYEERDHVTDGIRIVCVEKYMSRYNRWRTLISLYKKGLEIVPDIIHCHEPDSLFVSHLLRKKLKTAKVIYDCHEFHPESFSERQVIVLKPIIRSIVRRFENYLVSKSNAVITVNQKLVDRFKRLNSVVCLIPNYPKKESFQKIERNGDVFSQKTITMIYVGQLSSQRGLFTMLQSLKTLVREDVSAKLVLVGKINSKDKERFWQYIKDNNLSDLVDYKGFVSHEDTVKYLLSADIGLCLLHDVERYRWSEAIKYFEYSAAGLPVIASDLPSQQQLINHNKNGIVVSLDPVSNIVDAILQLFNNKDIARKMGKVGRDIWLNQQNWDTNEKKLFDLYNIVRPS